jgi:hypothetical protein
MGKYDSNLDYIISQIDKAFNVRDIMTEINILKFADDTNKARNMSHDPELDYDIVPLGNPSSFNMYYNRKTDSTKKIEKDDLISGSTGISAILYLFEKQDFYFVLDKNKIVGLVNISDINKLISYLPIYMTSVHAEVVMREFFRREEKKWKDYHEFLEDVLSNITKVYDEDRQNQNFKLSKLQRRFKKAKERGFYTDIYNELNFKEELAIYYYLINKLSGQSDWDRIWKYGEVRNRTMHAKDQLDYSSAEENLNQMMDFLQECKKIIDELSSGKP